MNANVFRGAVLLMALVLIVMPAAVSSFIAPVWVALALLAWLPYIGNLSRISLRQFWSSELGVVSVAYFARSGIPGGLVLINGSTTVPTAIQANLCPTIKAAVSFAADTDVQALVTHNWGLDASAPTYFDPEVFQMGGTMSGVNTSLAPNFTFDWSNTNVLKINKFNFVGTNGTYMFCLRRPHQVGM